MASKYIVFYDLLCKPCTELGIDSLMKKISVLKGSKGEAKGEYDLPKN